MWPGTFKFSFILILYSYSVEVMSVNCLFTLVLNTPLFVRTLSIALLPSAVWGEFMKASSFIWSCEFVFVLFYLPEQGNVNRINETLKFGVCYKKWCLVLANMYIWYLGCRLFLFCHILSRYLLRATLLQVSKSFVLQVLFYYWSNKARYASKGCRHQSRFAMFLVYNCVSSLDVEE